MSFNRIATFAIAAALTLVAVGAQALPLSSGSTTHVSHQCDPSTPPGCV